MVKGVAIQSQTLILIVINLIKKPKSSWLVQRWFHKY